MQKSTAPKELETASHYFKILGNSTRLCILCNLCKNKKLNVTDLIVCSEQSQSYVSQELLKLKKWNVVNFQQIGNENYYYLIDQNICKIINQTGKIFCNKGE